jgi:hypothetical protein
MARTKHKAQSTAETVLLMSSICQYEKPGQWDHSQIIVKPKHPKHPPFTPASIQFIPRFRQITPSKFSVLTIVQ